MFSKWNIIQFTQDVPTTQHQLQNQPSQVHQNQQVNASYWKSPGVSGIDTKSVGASVIDAKASGVVANFTNQSFPLIHNPQSSFSNVVPPAPQQVKLRPTLRLCQNKD